LIYDEKFINSFVYSDDGLRQNQSKIILKTDKINTKINEKNDVNKNNQKIISSANIYLNSILNLEKIFNIKTKPQKRFAQTFIKENLPKRYDELFNIDDNNHKSWWYEGLAIYKRNDLDICPWCKCKYELLDDNLQNQINSV